MDWEQALQINNGDYAYSPDGGGITHEADGTYAVMNGNLQAACAGKWDEVERKGLSLEDIPSWRTGKPEHGGFRLVV